MKLSEVMQDARQLPEPERESYLDFVFTALEALSKGHNRQVEQAIQILKGE